MPPLRQVEAGHGDPDADADDEGEACGDVVAHERAEPRRQGAARLQGQGHGVCDRRGGDNDASGEDDRPDVGDHAHDDRGDTEGVRDQSDAVEGPPTGRRAPQQRVGEVLAPDEDGGADRPEEEQVKHEPAAVRHESVDDDDDGGGDEPERD